MTEFIVPLFIIICILLCLKRREEVYSIFIDGAEKGMRTVIKILPAMIAVMSAAAMLNESGIMDFITKSLLKLLPIKLPAEVLSLALLRPVSGSGSVGLLADIINRTGADSMASRIASVICASSETTLYVLTVYFGSTRVKYTKRVLFAALIGDFVCVLTAILTCKIFF